MDTTILPTFYVFFAFQILTFLRSRAKVDIIKIGYISIAENVRYIMEIMWCKGCRIQVVETQHSVGEITAVLRSKDPGRVDK